MTKEELVAYRYVEMYDDANEFRDDFVKTSGIGIVLIRALDELVSKYVIAEREHAQCNALGITLEQAFRIHKEKTE